MAASSVNTFHSSCGENPSFYDKLNSVWHERALQIFMLIVLAHWGEHLVQAYQVYVMHWPRPKANGILGLWYPWLITSEWLHYGYAVVMLIGIWVLRKGFTGLALKWWTVSLAIQFWHHIEHLLLLTQAMRHHNFWDKPVPFSVLQLVIPRVELHLFYNAVVFVPMMIGMYYHMFPPENEARTATCTCAWHAPAEKIAA
jgi:hypothetical protein